MRKRTALVWLTAAAGVALMVAACGTVASGSPASGISGASGTQPVTSSAANADAALCREASAVGKADVRHFGIYPGYPMVPATHSSAQAVPNVPGEVTTTAATARWLARALCALPPTGPGVRYCPLAVLAGYTLAFTVHGRQLPTVTVRTSGCTEVTGVGPPRSTDTALLQKLASLTAAGDIKGGPVHRLSTGG